MRTRFGSAVLAAALLVGAAAGAAQAQDASGAAQDAARAQPSPWQPRVFSYALEQAGEATLDPFGSEGRREVVQLMAEQSLWQGRFVRSRMEDGPAGLSVTRDQGWYEIRGDHIFFYHADRSGATGRVEVSDYQAGRICGVDRESGVSLRYELIEGAGAGAVAPPPGTRATPGACGLSGVAGSRTGGR